MAAIETAIRNVLLADTSIAAAVGTRVRPMAMGHADVRPYITYQVTDGKSNATLDGINADDYRDAEFELGIYGDTYDDVMAVSILARNRLDQFGQTVSNIEFAPTSFDDETDIEQTVPEGQELPVYLRVQTYRALYRVR